MEISFTIAESSQESNAPEFKDKHTFVYRRVPFLNVTKPFYEIENLVLLKNFWSVLLKETLLLRGKETTPRNPELLILMLPQEESCHR